MIMDWKIEYQNDVGYNDESYWCWWEVSNGKTVFKCDEEEDAEKLCALLNNENIELK